MGPPSAPVAAPRGNGTWPITSCSSTASTSTPHRARPSPPTSPPRARRSPTSPRPTAKTPQRAIERRPQGLRRRALAEDVGHRARRQAPQGRRAHRGQGRASSPSSRPATAAAPSRRRCSPTSPAASSAFQLVRPAAPRASPTASTLRGLAVPARRATTSATSRTASCTGIIPWNFPFLMAAGRSPRRSPPATARCIKPASLHVAHRARAGEVVAGGRHPARRRQPHHRSRRHASARSWRSQPARRQGRVHRLHRGRPAHHAARVGHREEGDARARRQVGQHRARRRRPRPRRRRACCGARSSTTARCASRAPGRSCTRTIYDEFVGLLVERAGKIVIGDNMDMNTDLGPLVSRRARSRRSSAT